MPQQRTPYKRQKVQPSNPRAPAVPLWRIVNISANISQIALTGGLDGLTIKGIPRFAIGTSAAVPVDMVVVDPPTTPGQVDLVITWSEALPVPCEVVLEQPSTWIMNRQGARLQAGTESFPNYSSFQTPINMELHSVAGDRAFFDISNQFGQVCIGSGFGLENYNTIGPGNFVGWSAGRAVFEFPNGLNSGDGLYWPDGGTAVKGQYGGTLQGGSVTVP